MKQTQNYVWSTFFNRAFDISINSNYNQIKRKMYDAFVKNIYYDKKT